MKRLFIMLTLLLVGLTVQASPNYLHTVALEGIDDGYNIVLKTDIQPQVSKSFKGNDTLVITVKGVAISDNVNAVYKSTPDIKGLVVEKVSNDELKVYIQANGIANSTILSETADGTNVILSERFPIEKLLWTIAVIGILIVFGKSAKSITEYENSLVIKKDIKDREIELYRNFQKELSSMPKINCKINNAYATNVMPRSRRNYKELARL